MPFSPAPLLPGTSPLPTPGQRPPSRGAVRMGALTALPLLVGLLALGTLLLPHLLFLAPFLQAQAGGGRQATSGATFQGFLDSWTRGQTGGGYSTPASLQNLESQVSIFHMNAVIIPVVADMPERSGSELDWHATDAHDTDTLLDSDYIKAIQDARKAGLVPILELVVRQQDELSGSDHSPYFVGRAWFDQGSSSNFSLNGSSQNVVAVERTWLDSYVQFAVHYAQISQQYHLPYFIFGDQLIDVTYDTANTTRQADPGGIDDGVPGESFPKCSGRRDCEWRHVINAIRSGHYSTYGGHVSQQGGGYTGKLIYAASWNSAPDQGTSTPEFEGITWWDAVDYIGVDAFFPLTDTQADPAAVTLQNAWHGQGSDLAGQGDIYSRLQKVSDTYKHPIIFTAAGYESVPGDNNSPGQPESTNPDQDEQLNDMQALLQTFSGSPWWLGVFWSADEPIAPRTSQPGWATSSNWAGSSLADSKAAGKWLAGYYQNNPLPAGG